MGKSMLIREIPVYSEEFDIHGVIKDYGVVTKLFFTYENREIVMGIDRNHLEEEKFESSPIPARAIRGVELTMTVLGIFKLP